MEQLATDQTNDELHITSDHIQQMTNDLFVSMLDMEIQVDESKEAQFCSDLVQASVNIEAEQTSELRVIASESLTRQIACVMFAMEPSELSTAEAFDALGEIANVIGGNVKGMITKEGNLTIPTVGFDVTEVPKNSLCNAFRIGDSALHVYYTKH